MASGESRSLFRQPMSEARAWRASGTPQPPRDITQCFLHRLCCESHCIGHGLLVDQNALEHLLDDVRVHQRRSVGVEAMLHPGKVRRLEALESDLDDAAEALDGGVREERLTLR